ncbi:MAG: NAD-binding protein [Desulfobacterales bacterium]
MTLVLFLIYFVVSTTVYYLYGDPGTGLGDAIYMTGISFTTVGYSDSGFASSNQQKIIFTPLVIWGFLIQIVFVASAVNAFVALKIHIVLEELLMKFLTKFKKAHIVIFGIGKIAPHVITELTSVKASFVVVDNHPAKIETLHEQYSKINALRMPGKTPSEKILKDVNITNASVAIFDLGSDELNHIAGDLVRRENQEIKTISVNDQLDFLSIMDGEGKTAINPHVLCAMKIASMAFRPSVATFLDKMLYIQDGIYRIEQVTIQKDSKILGKTLKEIFVASRLEILVIGIEDREVFDIIPRGRQTVVEGMTIFLQGELTQIEAFRQLAEGETSLDDFLPPPAQRS